MRQYFHELKNFFRKGDMVLLLLMLAATTFGVVMIASAKNYAGNLRFIIIQIAAALLGILFYAIYTHHGVSAPINGDTLLPHAISSGWLGNLVIIPLA
jgi:cell division protein FtsW (lipid II flippase)